MNDVKKQTPIIIFFALIAVAFIVIGTVLFTPSQQRDIKEIIQPVKLVAGQTDSLIISDMFYAENYNLDFLENENVEIKFDKERNTLYFTPAPDFEGATIVEFEFGGNRFSFPLFSKIIAKQKFEFAPKKKYNKVNLFGSFNSWDRTNLEMTDKDNDGNYEIEIPLLPGQYQYKFFCEGDELMDPKNKVIVPNGIGGHNNVVTVQERFSGKGFLHVDNLLKLGHEYKYMFKYQHTDPKAFIKDKDVIAFIDNKRVYSDKIFTGNNKVEISVDPADLMGRHHLRVVVSHKGQISNIQELVLENSEPVKNNSDSWYDGTIYSLMIDRFNDGDEKLNNPVKHDSIMQKANYYGGDFQGVINKIKDGYFTDLGINILWLSPVYDNPNVAFKEFPAPHRWYSGYHGYWPIHHQKVEEKFGSMDKFKELIDIAHKHNIKVLLDFVSNHVHQDHPFFKKDRNWFGKLELPDGRLNLRFWDEFRLTTWFEPYLPSFDYQNSPEALKAMTDNAIWWLNETGADGFRHDAVKHVPNVFWRELTKKLKKEIERPKNREVYQIGETFGSYDLVGSYVNNGQLSSQFNFELYNVAQSVFINPERSFEDLSFEMNKTLEVFGPLHLMGNIMDSHDKSRYMAFADGDLNLSQWNAVEIGWNNPPKVDHATSYKKALLYYSYMFTIPGLPVVYYGSEFGMTGASDPDNRRMMRFGENLSENEKAMLKEVQKISKIRNGHTALRHGDFYTLKADKNIFAYSRSDLRERIIVVINKSKKSQEVEIDLPEFYKAEDLKDLLNGKTYKVENNKLKIKTDPLSYLFLAL
ncbi:MAG: alpha-amylase family glycosyl hydrolase [Rhodothermaceae bacterium]